MEVRSEAFYLAKNRMRDRFVVPSCAPVPEVTSKSRWIFFLTLQ